MYNEDYLQTARENEAIFRAILRDLKDNKSKRPLGYMIPGDLNPDALIEEIFDRYSRPELTERFTISRFRLRADGKAAIAYDDIGELVGFTKLRGNGVELRYAIAAGNSVRYETEVMDWEFKNGKLGDVNVFNFLTHLNLSQI